jgi:hypothetical protein
MTAGELTDGKNAEFPYGRIVRIDRPNDSVANCAMKTTAFNVRLVAIGWWLSLRTDVKRLLLASVLGCLCCSSCAAAAHNPRVVVLEQPAPAASGRQRRAVERVRRETSRRLSPAAAGASRVSL